jgi:peroxiredoxin Q/BCP
VAKKRGESDERMAALTHRRVYHRRAAPKDHIKGMDTMVTEGKKAPDFSIELDTGETLKLSKLKGAPVVVYFYPKDDTSGCTAEAKDFSELRDAFDKAGVRVIGISPDAVASKQKFRKKHALTVELGADPDKTAALAYGVWVEKSMYGRKYMGVERSTFLIDGAGKVVKAWHKVKVPGHAKEVLAEAKAHAAK